MIHGYPLLFHLLIQIVSIIIRTSTSIRLPPFRTTFQNWSTSLPVLAADRPEARFPTTDDRLTIETYVRLYEYRYGTANILLDLDFCCTSSRKTREATTSKSSGGASRLFCADGSSASSSRSSIIKPKASITTLFSSVRSIDQQGSILTSILH
jgi:hypothetical protein